MEQSLRIHKLQQTPQVVVMHSLRTTLCCTPSTQFQWYHLYRVNSMGTVHTK